MSQFPDGEHARPGTVMRLLILLFGLLAGCQTSENANLNKQTFLNTSFINRPLSDYIMLNGHNPENYFDMPGGNRVFVFGLPCKANWQTRPIEGGGTPAKFIVTQIDVFHCL